MMLGQSIECTERSSYLTSRTYSYQLAISAGSTTALVLPGSANAIAGEAYTIKLRETSARTPSSMLVDAPPQINGTIGAPLRWRHMKSVVSALPTARC
jgi:hypothetical protein